MRLVALLSLALATPVLAQVPWASQPAHAEPPAARLGGGGVEYAHDDGSASVNIGPPSSFDPDMLWGNYFEVEAGGEVITEIAVAFGSTFPSGGPVTFWLLGDPDADGDPRNATALVSVEADPDVSGNAFFRVAIPPTPVSGAFFVGASAQLAGGQDRPARVDTDARADRSWFFYDGDIADVVDDLATAAFGTRMDDATTVPFPGAFMVRAMGQPVSTTAEDEPTAASLRLGVAPNPSAGASRVTFTLASTGLVRVEVHDALGRLLAVVHEGAMTAGAHALSLPDGLAPGVYLARVRTEAGAATSRFVIRR
ncbi:MAG: T9SS type A sorting domain-containing protein [Bacteroidota bacterium]